METIIESFEKIGEDVSRFDIIFWQSQGAEAIFDAATEMILDYLKIRNVYVDGQRFDRTFESFQKA